MPFDRGLVHIARAAAHDAEAIAKRQAEACINSGAFKAPAADVQIDCPKRVRIEWDKSCFTTPPTTVDIHLWSPSRKVVEFLEVSFEPGFVEVDFKPEYCSGATPGAVSTRTLTIADHDLPWLTNFGESASFKVSNPVDPATQGSTDPPPVEDDTSSEDPVWIRNFFRGLAPGSIAAAVIVPILVIAIGVAIYIKFSRAKRAEKRKRFSEAVDKRMSTISTDWRSMSGAGAAAAIRHSMATTGRASMYGRPSNSIYGGTIFGEEPPLPPPPPGVSPSAIGTLGVGPRPTMQQVRPQDRVSRVSFATESVYSRPSMGDAIRPGMASRSLHYAHDIPVPPLPTARPSNDGIDGSPTLSPTQTQGPFSLSPEEIRARVGGQLKVSTIQEEEGRTSIDADFNREVLHMPAISLMRTGSNDNDNDFLVNNANAPSPIPSSPGLTPPSPVHTGQPQHSPLGMMPFMQSPGAAAAASPDDMLRAYAAARAAGGAPGAGPSTGMRTLYAPTMMQGQGSIVSGTTAASHGNNPYRKSMAPTEWSENEMEDATPAYGRAA